MEATNHTVDARNVDVSSMLISKHRNPLDWVLMLPEWESLIDCAINQLSIATTRQGINRKGALLSLPLEIKFEAIKYAILRADNRLPIRFSIKLASLWGVYLENRGQLENRLTIQQWNDLKRKLSLRLSAEHRSYKSAQNLIFQEYCGLVQKVTKRVCLESSKLEDCLQEGRLALIKAIDRIEPGRAFSAYATQWITRHIRNFLIRNKLPVSAPTNLISETLVARNTRSDIPQNLSQIFQALQQPQISFDEIDTSGIDQCSKTDSEDTPDVAAIKSDIRHKVIDALQNLTAKQQEIMRLKFDSTANTEELSNSHIGSLMGISGQQVGRRQKRALNSLTSILKPIESEIA